MSWTRWNGTQITANIKNATVKAVDKTAHVILTASQSQVPLDEGFLSRSGIVIIKNENNMPIAIICYGGGPGTGHPKIPYAIKWHETQANFQHGRKWKYLKDPFSQLAATALKQSLTQELRSIL